eukprot:superscaffoldBa00000069_g1099
MVEVLYSLERLGKAERGERQRGGKLAHNGICALPIEKQVICLTVPLWSVNQCPLGKSTTLGTVVLE